VLTLATTAADPAAQLVTEPYLQKALEIDPLDERLYEQLMQLHLQSGYPARALEIYHAAQSALKKGLDISPGSALLELARKAASN